MGKSIIDLTNDEFDAIEEHWMDFMVYLYG